jgi:hypothetical protein
MAKLTEVVRGLLLKHPEYTGPRLNKEFGVGLAWYSEFMRGAERVKPEVLQAIYEKLTGRPLIHPDVLATVEPCSGIRIGVGGQKRRKAKAAKVE